MKTLILCALLLSGTAAHANDLQDQMFDVQVLQMLNSWDAEDAANARRDLDAAYDAKDCVFLNQYWSTPHRASYADKKRYKAVCGGELGLR